MIFLLNLVSSMANPESTDHLPLPPQERRDFGCLVPVRSGGEVEDFKMLSTEVMSLGGCATVA